MTTYIPVRATVVRTQRLSETYIRITFGGPEMARLGSDYAVLDQRIKLIFTETGEPPALPANAGWYQGWLGMDPRERGVMRTYSVREQRMTADSTEYDVDFVLHGVGDGGHPGPASSWADKAAVGDKVTVVGPARDGNCGGSNNGIAFLPGEATHAIMVGDETAVPAIGRILDDAANQSPETEKLRGGVAVIELPTEGDIEAIRKDFRIPQGFEVIWLNRNGAARGAKTTEALAAALTGALTGKLQGATRTEPLLSAGHHEAGSEPLAEADHEELIWHQPGEVLDSEYFWIAGESSLVRSLRRLLVQQFGLKKGQISFMGYWKDARPLSVKP